MISKVHFLSNFFPLVMWEDPARKTTFETPYWLYIQLLLSQFQQSIYAFVLELLCPILRLAICRWRLQFQSRDTNMWFWTAGDGDGIRRIGYEKGRHLEATSGDSFPAHSLSFSALGCWFVKWPHKREQINGNADREELRNERQAIIKNYIRQIARDI